jgi:hypothetical protein
MRGVTFVPMSESLTPRLIAVFVGANVDYALATSEHSAVTVFVKI